MFVYSKPSRVLRFPVADGLVLSDELFMPRDPLFVRHQLEQKVFGLPLEHIWPLTAKVLEQCFPNIEAVAYIYPPTGAAQSIHAGFLRSVAEYAGSGKRKPLRVLPLHGIASMAV